MKPHGRTLRTAVGGGGVVVVGVCIIDLMSGPEAAVVIVELTQAAANYCNGYLCHLKISYHC